MSSSTYIASFEGANGHNLYQLLLRFPLLVVEGDQPAWAITFRNLIEGILQSSVVDVAFRIGYHSGRIHRSMLLNSYDQQRLFDLALRADGLNLIAQGTCTHPANRHEHDFASANFPQFRRTLCRDSYFANNMEIPCDFTLLPHMPRFLREAVSSRNDLSLQLSCCSHTLNPNELSSVRKLAYDLRSSGRLPEALLGHVDRLVQQMPGHRFLLQEYIGSGSLAGLEKAARLADALFRDSYVSMGFSDSVFGNAAPTELIDMGLHEACLESPVPQKYLWRGSSTNALLQAICANPDAGLLSLGITNVYKQPPVTKDLVVGLLEIIAKRLDEIERMQKVQVHRQTIAAMRTAVGSTRTDIQSAAGIARGIVDEICRKVFETSFPQQKPTVLESMIEKLHSGKLIPGPIYSAMHSVRMSGNSGTHRNNTLSPNDVHLCLMNTMRVVEWFLLEYKPA